MLMLDLKITTGSPEELKKAAEAIVALVVADTTAPTPENRDAWVSDLELRTKLELPLGREQGRWELVLTICEHAAKKLWVADGHPAATTLVILMALNAARRLPEPNPTYVETMILTARGLIDGIGMESESPPRRKRLESLLDYCIGIWARRVGNYQLSIDQQVRSAELAEEAGDIVGVAIAHLCEQVERLSLALMLGNPHNLSALRRSADRVMTVCYAAGEPIQEFWAMGNAPIHALLAHIWTKNRYSPALQDSWQGLLRELEEKDPKGYRSIESTIKAAEAGVALLNGQHEKARDLAQGVLGSNPKDDQACMTAHWVAACASKELSDFRAAKGHLEAMVAPGHEMHQLRSLATRELITLPI